MDAAAIPTLFSSLQIPSNHTSVGLSNLLSRNSQVKALFHHKRLPDVGWSDLQIQRLLLELSVLDTNCEESVKCQLLASTSSSSSRHFCCNPSGVYSVIHGWCFIGRLQDQHFHQTRLRHRFRVCQYRWLSRDGFARFLH